LGSALPSDVADPLLNAFTLAWGADRLREGLRGFASAYLEVRATVGFRRSLGDMLPFSASPSDYWHIPRLAVWTGFLPPGRPERELFPGLVLTALALGGLSGPA